MQFNFFSLFFSPFRECSLFSECGRFVILGSACYLPDEPHPPMVCIPKINFMSLIQNMFSHFDFTSFFSFILFLQHEVYRNNESVAPNPRNPLEDYTIHCVDIEVGVHCDSLKFKNDKIFLSHNQGIYLHKDVLAILSVQHQTIHVYQLDTDLGGFCPIVSIGKQYFFFKYLEQFIQNTKIYKNFLEIIFLYFFML